MPIFPSLLCSTPPELFKQIEKRFELFSNLAVFRARTLSQQLKMTLTAAHVFLATTQDDPHHIPRFQNS